MTSRRQSLRAMAGVTLVELMIAVAIVGILAAIAYPSYQRYVARTNRNAARACLSQEAQLMERHYSSNMTYADVVVASLNLPCERESGLDRRYTIELAGPPTRTTYALRAVPTALQTASDDCDSTLTLDQAGTRGPNTQQCR